MNKILIVEDEEITSITLETYLSSIGYCITDCVNSADKAHISIQKNRPDLVITDIMLIGQKTGAEFAREIYYKYQLPIVFLTAYCDDDILELAKQSNPVGYILKPYKEEELKATLTLAFHRLSFEKLKKTNKNPLISIDKYFYNLDEKKLYLDTQVVQLGPRSNYLLYTLVKNRNQVVSYETLIRAIWEENYESNLDKLRHLVGRLKERLQLDSIYAIKNVGYVFRNE